MELVELQSDTILKQTYADVGIPDFYKYLASAKIIAMFGSTYVCEQFFSSMKHNKSALRSRLTNEHLTATLRVADSRDIKPNFDKLISAKRSQLSSSAILNN